MKRCAFARVSLNTGGKMLMNYLSDKTREIEIFMDGIASVCDDTNIIKAKAIEKYGKDFEGLILYLILLRTKDFSAEQFSNILHKPEIENHFSDSEINCAKRNGLIIVSGYSDDLIELDGAIQEEGDCFMGNDFHLIQKNGEWKLEQGIGNYNNISAKWYEGTETDEFGETIPWTYETDIPHSDFLMTFRGDIFCKAFVFDIKDLKK
jgi:hypothetical protein